jgi:protein SCO1/2
LARESYFAKVERSANVDFLHTEAIFLVDGHGRIRGVYDGSLQYEITRLIEDIATLERERA